MTAVQDFYSSFSFLLAFLIATAILETSAGEKVTIVFLWLVLLSMAVTNANKFTTFISGKGR